jgi:hypothetical protein
MLAWLWTRLSEGGAQVSISGRALRRFPERELDRLLRARVLIEQRKVDSWSLCAQCDCGLDARPIRQNGGELRACCPYDVAEDVVLDENDIRRFGIDAERLAARIAASGGLEGGVAPIAEEIWSIGTAPPGVAIVLCSDPHQLARPGTVLAIKAAVGVGHAVLIAPELGMSTTLRLKEAGLSTANLAQVLIPDAAGTDRLEPGRLAELARAAGAVAGGEAAPPARLRISRARRTVQLDGHDIVLSLTGFDAFVGAAEKRVAGEVMLTYQELHSLTNRASHRDVINELRDQLESHGLTREQTFGLVKTIHGRGMTIGLARSDIDIRD